MKNLTFLFLLLAQFSFAQSLSVEGIINRIEFEQDSIKSIFDWVTDNVKYDVAKMQSIKKGGKATNRSQYKTRAEYENAKLQKVIKTKKGVCQDYSLLFDALVKELGYQSYVIRGYTKNNKGKVVYSMGHAWNAVKVNGTWKFYEPTWGAGYVKDESKFVKKYNPKWYDVSPDEMLKNHMPYDPMWQLSEKPMTYEEFNDNKTASYAGEKFDYQAMLDAYFKQSEKEQMQTQLQRSETMGDGTRLLERWRKSLAKSTDLHDVRQKSGSLKETAEKCKESVELFNDYISAKNKGFRSKKWTAQYAESTLLQIKDQMTSAVAIFESVEVKDSKVKRSINQQISQCNKLLTRLDSELKYISKLK